VVGAAESGRAALALSNRRPHAPILALARSEEIARVLSLCWGVEALVLPEAQPRVAEAELSYGMEWAKSHALVRPGQHAVLLRGQTATQATTAAILAGEVP